MMVLFNNLQKLLYTFLQPPRFPIFLSNSLQFVIVTLSFFFSCHFSDFSQDVMTKLSCIRGRKSSSEMNNKKSTRRGKKKPLTEARM